MVVQNNLSTGYVTIQVTSAGRKCNVNPIFMEDVPQQGSTQNLEHSVQDCAKECDTIAKVSNVSNCFTSSKTWEYHHEPCPPTVTLEECPPTAPCDRTCGKAYFLQYRLLFTPRDGGRTDFYMINFEHTPSSKFAYAVFIDRRRSSTIREWVKAVILCGRIVSGVS